MASLFALVAALAAFTYFQENSANQSKTSRNHPKDPFQGRFKNPPGGRGNHSIDKGHMLRCHNCTIFFPAGNVVHEVMEGHVLEFCSHNCQRNFHTPY